MSTMTHRTDPALAFRSAILLPGRSAAFFEQSLAQASLQRVEANEFLFAEGDPISHLYRVETGAIALYKVLADGRRQVMGFAYPGDLIGLGAEGEHAMNAQAIKPTRVRSLPVGSLRQSALSDPTLGFKLYEALARELAATRDLMITTGHRSAFERVASFLIALSRRNERTGEAARDRRSADDARRHRGFPRPDHRDRQPHLHQTLRADGADRAAADQPGQRCLDSDQLQSLAAGEQHALVVPRQPEKSANKLSFAAGFFDPHARIISWVTSSAPALSAR